MKLRIESNCLLMALGLLPLLYLALFVAPRYVVGWGIGTYPLIVISFIAGMQFQRTKNLVLRAGCVAYPVLTSLAILANGRAMDYYMLGLLVAVGIDAFICFLQKERCSYLVCRGGLTACFILLLFTIGY